MSFHNKQEGFTLIELLVVLAVVSILATTIIPSFLKARDKGRIARAQISSKVVDNIIALQDYNNILGIWHDQELDNSLDGQQIGTYLDPNTGNSIVGTNATWSSDVPIPSGMSVYSPSGVGIWQNAGPINPYGSPKGFSVAFWVKFDVRETYFYAWSWLSGGALDTNIGTGVLYSGHLYPNASFFLNHNVGGLGTPGFNYFKNLEANQWYHITYTIKDGYLALYIDGVKVYDISDAGILTPNFLPAFVWGFGSSQPVKIYNVRIWQDFFDPRAESQS